MTPPTPAAVRAAMKEASEGCTAEESRAFCADNRFPEEILRDHIRAIAAGMRNLGDAMTVDRTAAEVRQVLREYADRLEGK